MSAAAGGRPANPLKGEFSTVLAGERLAFDTTLGTVALIEERCGGVPIVEAINTAVFGRRARDVLALLAGALAACGHPEAEALASRTAAVEAEAFVLALMAALGFELVRRSQGPREDSAEGDAGPFAPAPGATSGASAGPRPGASADASPSAP